MKKTDEMKLASIDRLEDNTFIFTLIGDDGIRVKRLITNKERRMLIRILKIGDENE